MKLVREHINEFKRYDNPYAQLGIGKRIQKSPRD